MSDGAKVVGNGNGSLKENTVSSARKKGVLGNWYSDEWYTTEKDVDTAIGLLQPKLGSVVMCPFDTAKSQFVQKLKNTHQVIFEVRDWLDKDYKYDYLITNPPFSIKDAVIKRVAESGKPSLLILPLDVLSGVKRREIYRQYGFPAFYIPERRLSYINQDGELKQGSNFASIMALFHTKHAGVIW
jgi:hypothetical protein